VGQKPTWNWALLLRLLLFTTETDFNMFLDYHGKADEM
jgi:hypothetical protein